MSEYVNPKTGISITIPAFLLSCYNTYADRDGMYSVTINKCRICKYNNIFFFSTCKYKFVCFFYNMMIYF